MKDRRPATLALTGLFLVCQALCGQEFQFRYFGNAEGLANLAVRQIYQDRDGFLWVSTENGIFRYDGERFEPFGVSQGMPVNSGASFGEGPDGSLLAGGDFGLYRFSGKFERIDIGTSKVNWAQGISSDTKGHTFIGTDSGLIELSVDFGLPSHPFVVRRVARVQGTSGASTYGVFPDKEALWYGCGTEVCVAEQGKTVVLGRESGLPACSWLVILKDGEGNIWVRGRNTGVFVRPHGEKRFRQAEMPIPSGSLGGLPSVDRDGRVLLPSSVGLLLRNADRWQTIDRASGLKGTVYSVFEDRQRTLWIGLAGRGLVRWSGYREWEKYTSDGGLLSDLIYEILPEADGSLEVGSEGGLFRGFPNHAGMKWLRVPGVPSVPVHSVRRSPAGDLWFGTETHGAGRIDARTHRVKWFGESEGLTAKAPYCLRFDRSGRLWAATDAGLFIAEAPYRRFSRIDALPARRFWNVTEGADGRIWAGGADGLFEFSSGHWTNYTRASGLSNQEVISIAAAPDGSLWVGYRFGNGIDRVRPSGSKISIERGVQRPGTLGIVYFLEFDARGRLWAGTERGVDVWDGARWSHYDSRDGLAWDDCDLNGFAAEPDGSVWIGTAGGLSHYTPPRSNPAAALPHTVFTRLTLGQTDVLGKNNPSAAGKSDAFRARYSVLNVRQTDNVVFRYRLMPSQSGWTETLQRELEFAELPPGEYRLQVDASDNDGKWGGRAADFSFVMPTPWQQSWWFLGLCALIPILAAGVAVRFRILAARRRERELVLIVEQKTTDLKRLNEDLLRLSSLDPLTGLANRRVFDCRISEECTQLATVGFPVSMLILDIDWFKTLNDTHGHQRGDEYLSQVAAALALIARPDRDIAARYGGEEFALILSRTNAAEALLIAERVRLAVAELALPHPASPVADFLTVSIGVSTATAECPASPETLIGAADQALYRAKRTGRNRSVAAEGRYSDLETLSSRLSAARYQTT